MASKPPGTPAKPAKSEKTSGPTLPKTGAPTKVKAYVRTVNGKTVSVGEYQTSHGAAGGDIPPAVTQAVPPNPLRPPISATMGQFPRGRSTPGIFPIPTAAPHVPEPSLPGNDKLQPDQKKPKPLALRGVKGLTGKGAAGSFPPGQ
jgi:hypothetical protein